MKLTDKQEKSLTNKQDDTLESPDFELPPPPESKDSHCAEDNAEDSENKEVASPRSSAGHSEDDGHFHFEFDTSKKTTATIPSSAAQKKTSPQDSDNSDSSEPIHQSSSLNHNSHSQPISFNRGKGSGKIAHSTPKTASAPATFFYNTPLNEAKAARAGARSKLHQIFLHSHEANCSQDSEEDSHSL